MENDDEDKLKMRSRHKYSMNLALWCSAGFLILLVLMCLLHPLINSDSTQGAYHQNQRLSKLSPFTSINLIKVRKNASNVQSVDALDYDFFPYDSLRFDHLSVEVWYGGESNEMQLVDVVYPVDELTREALMNANAEEMRFLTMEDESIQISATQLSETVQGEHLINRFYILGTDHLGRDMFSRLMAGGRISLSIAVVAVILSVLIGLIVGTLAGYFGGLADRVLNWVLSLFWAIPAVLFVVVLTLAFGSSKWAVILGISFTLWVEMAQVIRGRVRSIRQKEYVKASQLLGLTDGEIITRHILPNVLSPVYVLAATTFADALMLEAGLSFLGVGIAPPDPSWGNMIRTTYGYMLTENYAYLVLVPSFTLVLVILAIVVLSKQLKGRLEVRFESRLHGRV